MIINKLNILKKIIAIALLTGTLNFCVEFLSVKAQTVIDYSNPAIISGSSFGNYFQQLYKIGYYNQMLAFTSTQSRKHFTDSLILKRFAEMDFGYHLRLKAVSINGFLKTLNYESDIRATRTIIRLTVIVENDTAKIILPEDFLKQELFLFR